MCVCAFECEYVYILCAVHALFLFVCLTVFVSAIAIQHFFFIFFSLSDQTAKKQMPKHCNRNTLNSQHARNFSLTFICMHVLQYAFRDLNAHCDDFKR